MRKFIIAKIAHLQRIIIESKKKFNFLSLESAKFTHSKLENKSIESSDAHDSIIVYGGSFDPLHYGHYAIITHLLKSFCGRQNNANSQCKLIIMPTFCNPLKNQSLFSAETRLKMCHTIADSLKNTYPLLEVSDFEIRQKRAVYTIESIEYIRTRFCNKRVLFALGVDSLIGLDKWHNAKKLSKIVSFIVFSRDSLSLDVKQLPSDVSIFANFALPYNPKQYASSYIRTLLTQGRVDEALDLIPQCLHKQIKAYF